MKKLTNSLLLLAISALLSNCSKENISLNNTDETNGNHTSSPVNIENLPGKYIVVFKNEASFKGNTDLIRGKALGLLKRNNASEMVPEHVYSYALQGFSVGLSIHQMEAISNDESVAYIEQDRTITLNQNFRGTARGGKKKPGGGGGDVTQPSQTTPWGITRVGGAQNGTGKKAWIIDSGIDLDHPDLNVGVSISKSFLSGKQKNNPDDENGHGTHVAGTVAAKNDGIGVVGVAAGATVISVRVLDARGSGSISGVIAGVDYVAKNGASGDAANMSLGGGVSTSLDAAVLAASAKVKFALAAGNESDDVKNHSPARTNGPNIYTVSAMDVNDNWAYFSNYSSTIIEYCAPGVSIHSTWKGAGYNTISGTSMAAPHVCGLLLMGTISASGTVNNDPATPNDPIAHK